MLDSTVRFNFTPRMEKVMREGMRNKLIEAGVDKTNDLNKYCDCYINSLQKHFTMKEIMDSGFGESPKLQELVEKCDSFSKRK